MKQFLSVVACVLALVSCGRQGVRTFWDTHSIDYTDVGAAEDQFADFAELAVASDPEDAVAALDALFDKLLEDEVAYYLYSEWMEGAFYSLLSPCRSAALYSKAVERLVSDGVFSMDDCQPWLQRRDWIQYNQAGQPATVPGVTSFGEETLVLVLDLGCPSCREALESVAAEWPSLRRIAVGCGHGPQPSVEGWEYLFPENADAVFDPRMTPVYFIVSANGTVETSYSLAL